MELDDLKKQFKQRKKAQAQGGMVLTASPSRPEPEPEPIVSEYPRELGSTNGERIPMQFQSGDQAVDDAWLKVTRCFTSELKMWVEPSGKWGWLVIENNDKPGELINICQFPMVGTNTNKEPF